MMNTSNAFCNYQTFTSSECQKVSTLVAGKVSHMEDSWRGIKLKQQVINEKNSYQSSGAVATSVNLLGSKSVRSITKRISFNRTVQHPHLSTSQSNNTSIYDKMGRSSLTLLLTWSSSQTEVWSQEWQFLPHGKENKEPSD